MSTYDTTLTNGLNMSKLPDILVELVCVEDDAQTKVVNWSHDSELKELRSWCWVSDHSGRKTMNTFMSYNKRFTRAMRSLEAFHNAYADHPVINKLTEILTESWSRRFHLYRETRSIYHEMQKNMNVRQEQLMAEKDPFDDKFTNRVQADVKAIVELRDAWIRDYSPKVIKSLDDIPFISNAYDRDYAVRSMLAVGSFLDTALPPADQPSSSSMKQSPASSSSTLSTSGESLKICNSSMTALTSDRHNSSSMDVFLSLMAKFREKQDEASFIMSPSM